MEEYRNADSLGADGRADGTLTDKMSRCLRRLRAPAVRLSYRMEKTFIPDLDREQAACGCGTDSAPQPHDGGCCSCTDDACPISDAQDAPGGDAEGEGTPSAAGDGNGCGCGSAEDTARTCGKPCTMIETGHLTVRLFDLALGAALTAVMGCCLRMKMKC